MFFPLRLVFAVRMFRYGNWSGAPADRGPWAADLSPPSRPALGGYIVHAFFKKNYTVQRRHSRHTHTHPYEYTYANPTPMSTSEGLSTGRSGDSRSHQWHLVIDGNVAYHLTHNTCACAFEVQGTVEVHLPVLRLLRRRRLLGLRPLGDEIGEDLGLDVACCGQNSRSNSPNSTDHLTMRPTVS
jgi:hypothetical protein